MLERETIPCRQEVESLSGRNQGKVYSTSSMRTERVIAVDANEQVLLVLKDSPDPMRSNELVEKTGLDKKEVDKAIKNLKKQGVIESPKRCYYAPVR